MPPPPGRAAPSPAARGTGLPADHPHPARCRTGTQLSESAFLEDFAGGVDEALARALYVVQGPIAGLLFKARTTTAAWRDKPCYYSISRQDRRTAPELEQFLAERMNATTIEVDSSHLAMVTHPEAIADLIIMAAHGTRSPTPNGAAR
ncbi:alpha/beta fold hydrolase [Micromonospora sp. NPDC005174]|uniref:alpha/beta fold hydrolase n=1 Tax=Micromonospora sp. NPDC005174 TaxID=3157018 RepID=UPI00339ECB27